jgi:hypothetical protein
MTEKVEQYVVLVRQKEELKNHITTRLEVGNALLVRAINNEQQKQEWWDEFIDWDYYNLELIRQAFDKPNNSYALEYKRHVGGGGIYLGGFSNKEPSFQETVETTRDEMRPQVSKLKRFLDKIELLKQSDNLVKSDSRKAKIEQLINLLSKFHKVAQELRERRQDRDTIIIGDEYDVQDLLNGLLHIHFADIRKEDFSPSNSGANSRLDFVLKTEKIILEVKMSNSNLGAKELGEELLIDIGRYKEYPACSDLVIFIYDKGDFIRNKRGLITDLQKQSTSNFSVTVVITPD